MLPTDYPGLLAPLLVSRLNAAVASTKLMQRMPPVANVVISNVPGPQVPLYLAGAQMKTFFPVSLHRGAWHGAQHHRADLLWPHRLWADRLS